MLTSGASEVIIDNRGIIGDKAEEQCYDKAKGGERPISP